MTNIQVTEKLHDMFPAQDLQPQRIGEGIAIHHKLDGQYIFTPRAYKVPVRIEVSAKTDSSNIRIKFGKGQVIFNWERNYDSLRYSDPAKGKSGNNDMGRIPVDEWVHIVWEIEPSWMKVTVNGEERLFLEQNFSKVVGQAGIGAAFRSHVTVKSFAVAGEETEPLPPPAKPLYYEFDESHIAVPSASFDEAAAWYTRHLGQYIQQNAAPTPIHPSLKGIILQFPQGRGSLHLVSMPGELEHFRVDWGKADGFRYRIKSVDAAGTYDYMKRSQIISSELTTDGCGKETFDFFDPWGTRLTVVQGTDSIEPVSASGLYGFELPTIQVKDLELSVKWYRHILGLKRDGRRSNASAVLLKGLWRHDGVQTHVVWLEQARADLLPAPINPAVRQYFYVERHNFQKAYAKLKKSGIPVSDIVGSAFHFHDPDGNRINVFG